MTEKKEYTQREKALAGYADLLAAANKFSRILKDLARKPFAPGGQIQPIKGALKKYYATPSAAVMEALSEKALNEKANDLLKEWETKKPDTFWSVCVAQIEKMKGWSDIDTETPEGRLLVAAIAMITTESRTDCEPDTVFNMLKELQSHMYEKTPEEMRVPLSYARATKTADAGPQIFEEEQAIIEAEKKKHNLVVDTGDAYVNELLYFTSDTRSIATLGGILKHYGGSIQNIPADLFLLGSLVNMDNSADKRAELRTKWDNMKTTEFFRNENRPHAISEDDQTSEEELEERIWEKISGRLLEKGINVNSATTNSQPLGENPDNVLKSEKLGDSGLQHWIRLYGQTLETVDGPGKLIELHYIPGTTVASGLVIERTSKSGQKERNVYNFNQVWEPDITVSPDFNTLGTYIHRVKATGINEETKKYKTATLKSILKYFGGIDKVPVALSHSLRVDATERDQKKAIKTLNECFQNYAKMYNLGFVDSAGIEGDELVYFRIFTEGDKAPGEEEEAEAAEKAERVRWQCKNPGCSTIFAEYVNGCPVCSEKGIRSKVELTAAPTTTTVKGATAKLSPEERIKMQAHEANRGRTFLNEDTGGDGAICDAELDENGFFFLNKNYQVQLIRLEYDTTPWIYFWQGGWVSARVADQSDVFFAGQTRLHADLDKKIREQTALL